jgi:hypothetical protein
MSTGRDQADHFRSPGSRCGDTKDSADVGADEPAIFVDVTFYGPRRKPMSANEHKGQSQQTDKGFHTHVVCHGSDGNWVF